MDLRLDGRVALVTGGGRGIGRAISLAYAAAGATVAVATRSTGPGEATVEAIRATGGQADLFASDVGQREAVRALVEKVAARYGRLDVVVHNAASLPNAEVGTIEDDKLDACFDLNLKAAFWLLGDALPYLGKSPAGRFLCVSSITGVNITNRGYSAYGASKAALNGFIRQAGAELAARGVRVNGVAPGVTLTETAAERMAAARMDMSSAVPTGVLTRPEDVAAAMLFLASDAASQITGQVLTVDGGQSLHFM